MKPDDVWIIILSLSAPGRCCLETEEVREEHFNVIYAELNCHNFTPSAYIKWWRCVWTLGRRKNLCSTKSKMKHISVKQQWIRTLQTNTLYVWVHLCTLQMQPWGRWSVYVGFGWSHNTPRWRGQFQQVWISIAQSSATSPPTAWNTTGPHHDSRGCTRTGCSLCRHSQTLGEERELED